ncbi:hypothetical protein Tco_1238767 [Tanacetum coccineum]
MLSSDSEDINEGPSKGKVPKEDINEGPSKGKLAPLGSSARPRPEVGLELAKLFKYGLPPDLRRLGERVNQEDERRGKEKVVLRDEVSAARQEGLPPG